MKRKIRLRQLANGRWLATYHVRADDYVQYVHRDPVQAQQKCEAYARAIGVWVE